MDNNKTDITVLLDRSGSMSSCRLDVIGGLNEFINKQKEVPGSCVFTLVQFDSVEPNCVTFNAVDIREVPVFLNFEPRGGTPLLDALGRTITETGARLRAMPENDRPGKVIFVVITDGYENSSKEFKKADVAKIVKAQQDKYNWDFVFLGANMDAISEGHGFGFAALNSVTFSVDKIGSTMRSTSGKLATYRVSNSKADLAYTEAERKSFVGDK